MTFKKIQLGIIAAAMFTAPFAASAADLPSRYKAPAYVAPAYGNWSGFYIGANVGYGFGTSEWENPAITLDPSGFLAGATIGYNFQTGMWVWGIEGDINYSAMDDSVACPGGTCSVENKWLATVRARIGYGGWGSFMPYITGGAAFGAIDAIRSPGGTTSETQIGWTVGAGLEYMLFSSWSVKAEYLYVDLGSFACPTCGAAPNDVSFTTNIVRAGINYRF